SLVDAGVCPDLRFDVIGHVAMLLEELAHVVFTLADAIGAVTVPGARLFDDFVQHAQIDHLAFPGDAFAIQDIEIGDPERRRHLVLHHLDARFAADHLIAALDGADAADIETDRGVELQRVAAPPGFRIAEHNAGTPAHL